MPAEDGPFSFPHYSHPLGISSTACSVLGMMMGMRCLHDLRVETGPVSLLWANLRRRKAAEYRPGGEDLAETAGSSETYYGSSSGGSSPHQSGPWRSNHGVIHSLRSGAPWLVGHRSELLAGSWAAAPWDLQLPWEENSSLKLGGRALRALGAAQPVLGLMSLSSLLLFPSLFPPRFALSFFSFPLLLSLFLCLLFLTRMAQKAFLWSLPSPEFSGPPPISLNLRLLVFPLPPVPPMALESSMPKQWPSNPWAHGLLTPSSPGTSAPFHFKNPLLRLHRGLIPSSHWNSQLGRRTTFYMQGRLGGSHLGGRCSWGICHSKCKYRFFFHQKYSLYTLQKVLTFTSVDCWFWKGVMEMIELKLLSPFLGTLA